MTTSSVAFLSPQTAGDLNVVVMGWSDPNASVISVTDSAGNSYTLAAGPTTTDGYWVQSTYYASNIVGSASNTVSVVLSGPADVEVRVLEYSGVVATSRSMQFWRRPRALGPPKRARSQPRRVMTYWSYPPS